MRSIGNCGNNIRFSSKLTFTWERGSGMGGKEKGEERAWKRGNLRHCVRMSV